MTPWLRRCPQGHASVEPRQDGTYRCGSCEAKYRVGPFDAREVEFPVAVEPIATPDAVDVLAALDAATQRRPSAAARQLSTPLKATARQLLTLRERGLVEAVDVTGRSARWRLTTAGEQAVDGSVDPNAGCELATDGGEDEDATNMTETDDAVDGRDEQQSPREEVWNEYEVTMYVYKTGDRMVKETVVAPDFDRAREEAKDATGYEVEEIDFIKKVGDVTVTVKDQWTFRHNNTEDEATGWSTHYNWHDSPEKAQKEADEIPVDHFETEIVSRTVRVEDAE